MIEHKSKTANMYEIIHGGTQGFRRHRPSDKIKALELSVLKFEIVGAWASKFHFLKSSFLLLSGRRWNQRLKWFSKLTNFKLQKFENGKSLSFEPVCQTFEVLKFWSFDKRFEVLKFLKKLWSFYVSKLVFSKFTGYRLCRRPLLHSMARWFHVLAVLMN